MSNPTKSSVVSNALETMASVTKPSKRSLKSMVLAHRESIEAARAQGYTYEEIARELQRATKEAYPDDPSQWVIIAPSSLRKYLYQARKLQSKNTPSLPKAIANPFEHQL